MYFFRRNRPNALKLLNKPHPTNEKHSFGSSNIMNNAVLIKEIIQTEKVVLDSFHIAKIGIARARHEQNDWLSGIKYDVDSSMASWDDDPVDYNDSTNDWLAGFDEGFRFASSP